jgi:aspartyl-tRNA(Asn)/glutamyl-tRNA(Gln) amidotransferase subunit B
VLQVLEEHPVPVSQYLNGRTKVFGFLVGQIVKKSGGMAQPQLVQELLRAELARRGGSAPPGGMS